MDSDQFKVTISENGSFLQNENYLDNSFDKNT